MRGQIVKQWLAFGVDLEQRGRVSVLVSLRLRSGSGNDEAAVHTCENVYAGNILATLAFGISMRLCYHAAVAMVSCMPTPHTPTRT